MPITIETIAALTANLAAARAVTAERVTALETEIQDAQRRKLPGIRAAIATENEAKAALVKAVDSARALFAEPRTRVFAGITVGLRKGGGSVEWDDDAQVVALIRKHLSKAQAETLIHTEERPIVEALKELDVATLARIGCEVESTGDQVVVRAAKSPVEKLVAAFRKKFRGESIAQAA